MIPIDAKMDDTFKKKEFISLNITLFYKTKTEKVSVVLAADIQSLIPRLYKTIKSPLLCKFVVVGIK